MDRRTLLAGAAAALTFPGAALARSPLDIAAHLIADANMLTLVDGLVEADLLGTLRSDGPFTMFAPKNRAFAGMTYAAGTVTTGSALRARLLRHIVPGRYSAFQLMGRRTTLQPLAGAPLIVDGTRGGLIINGRAASGRAEIDASNGVIHQINRLLHPA